MKIIKIKWNPRVMDVTHIGEKTGTKFTTCEAEIDKVKIGSKWVEKIEEISLNVYEIYYYEHGNKTILRVFNPCEVLFEGWEEKS